MQVHDKASYDKKGSALKKKKHCQSYKGGTSTKPTKQKKNQRKHGPWGFLIQFRAFWHIMGLKRIFLSKVILVSIFGTKKHFAVHHCGHPKSPLGLAVSLLHGYLAISSGGLPFSPVAVASPLPRVCTRRFRHCCWHFTWILRSKTAPCWNLF